ncbi:MAG: tetratricopeptide repeat protein [Gammaproteobacteria bacterium]|nr:tetratricopeptide repeat protein [Gammaproteobacteria bacterium]
MSEYLSDEERVEWLRNWWSRHGVAIIAGIVVAVAGVIGWRWYQDFRIEQAETASSDYSDYLAARVLGDASELAADLAEAHEGTTYHVFTLLHEAQEAADGEDWERSAALLSASMDYAGDGVVRDRAALRLAKVQWQLGEADEALETLSGVLGSGFALEVAELTGDILAGKGDSAGAREAYESAIQHESVTDIGRMLLELKLATVVPDAPGDPGNPGNPRNPGNPGDETESGGE